MLISWKNTFPGVVQFFEALQRLKMYMDILKFE